MKKTLMIVLMIFFASVGWNENLSNPGLSSNYNISSEKKETSYEIGYLKKGAAWQDEAGKAYYNPEKVKVEVWKQKIVTGTGGKLIQIYFLEGNYIGRWGYVREISLSQ